MIKTWVETMLRSAQIDPAELQSKIADMFDRHIRMEQRQVRIEEKLDLLLSHHGTEYGGDTVMNGDGPLLVGSTAEEIEGTDNGGEG